MWRPRGDGSPRGYADVSVRFRGTRRPHGVRDVPSRKQRYGSQADGTARAIRVGRPRLVGEITPPRKSQRSAHKPASCLRGSVAEPPTEESSRFSAGRMSSTANSSQSVEMTHALAPSSAFSDETAYSMFEKWVRIFSAATES